MEYHLPLFYMLYRGRRIKYFARTTIEERRDEMTGLVPKIGEMHSAVLGNGDTPESIR